jgi:serine/threonine-protein kinase RIO1
MIETKDKEISKLMEHKNMRQMGLRCSEQLLQNDTQTFIDFFSRIKKKARDANDVLERYRKTRTNEQNKLKKINE